MHLQFYVSNIKLVQCKKLLLTGIVSWTVCFDDGGDLDVFAFATQAKQFGSL